MTENSTTAQVTAVELAVEPYIKKREVARRLERTPRTVENMMRDGKIPFYRIGNRVLFRWSEVQNHLTETCRICRS